MKGVTRVGAEFYGKGVKPAFPSLRTLSFRAMDNWEKWLCCGSRRGEFPRLQKLCIWDCPKISGKLPKQNRSLKKLEIDNCPKLLVASLAVPAISELWMSNYGELQLKKPFRGFIDLETSHLSSLGSLCIRNCPELMSLTGSGLQHLTSLEKLLIDDCPRLESFTASGLQHLTSLKKLEIRDCSQLQSLIEAGLQHLTSLRELEIANCPKLRYLMKQRLPDAISYLNISKYPLLEKQSQFGKGQDWHYIAHIPRILINHVLF